MNNSTTSTFNPAALLDVSALFQSELFSDIIVSYGGRQMKCHKVVLCGKSDYSKIFADKPIIPLLDVRSDKDCAIVEAVLRYLYNGHSWEAKSQAEVDAGVKDWRFHLQVSIAGKKYGIPSLQEQSYLAFQFAASHATDVKEVLNMLDALPEYFTRVPGTKAMLERLNNEHAVKLFAPRKYGLAKDATDEELWAFISQTMGAFQWLVVNNRLSEGELTEAFKMAEREH